MLHLLTAVALISTPEVANGPLTALGSPEPPGSYLFRMHARPDKQIDWQREVYIPREGDLLFFDNHSTFMTRVYKLVGTDGPRHAAIVYRRTDGSLASLEAGANWALKVEAIDVDKRLHDYDGTILVRRLKQPLTAEQSKKLTEFCTAQEGKSYAVGRIALQLTPFRPRGLLNPVFGKTALDRDRWICSELVASAATAAEILSAKLVHANALFPRDLCYDDTVDLTPHYELPALWYPRGELEFVDGGVRVVPAPR
jgi:hypothetical protein